MKKIGFIGLGTMGLRMAKRLLSAGFELSAYNRTAEKANVLVDDGARFAINPKQLAENSDVIITMVSDDNAVLEIMEKLGAFKGARPGTVFIDCSTISVKTTKDLADKAEYFGFHWLDAPTLGGPAAAEAGELPFVVGGPKYILDQNLDVFNALGKVVWMGRNGMGQAAKIVHNMACGIMLEAFSEAIVLGEKFGLTRKQILETLSNGGAAGPLLKAKAPKFEQNCWKPSFALAMMAKDLDLAKDAAESFKLSLPALSATKELYDMAKMRGFGNLDSSAVIKALEKEVTHVD
ncbi:MAG: NAD(P)-dependent oxidoreductase [Candidatus Azambacteria bacterium]|nr:NAD(P)-dependent oxidoreductase [Candidatus Azambacteria bacterium]